MEDLLKPRYKVISDYPENGRPIGHIIDVYNSLFNKESVFELNSHIDFYERYPHLFRKMDWWEDRKPEEMPEYVKWVEKSPLNKERLLPERGMIEKAKAIKWGTSFQFEVESQINSIQACYFIPATLAEYLNQNH